MEEPDSGVVAGIAIAVATSVVVVLAVVSTFIATYLHIHVSHVIIIDKVVLETSQAIPAMQFCILYSIFRNKFVSCDYLHPPISDYVHAVSPFHSEKLFIDELR